MEQLNPIPKRVLIVDDERCVREIIKLNLELNGFAVDEAAFAQQALDLFVANDYDLMTLDFRMPGLDGSKLHYVLSKGFGHGRRVSEIIPQRIPPVLVITGCADDPTVEELLQRENVVGILEKPITHDALIGAIKTIFTRIDSRKASHARLIAQLGSRIKSRRRIE